MGKVTTVSRSIKNGSPRERESPTIGSLYTVQLTFVDCKEEYMFLSGYRPFYFLVSQDISLFIHVLLINF